MKGQTFVAARRFRSGSVLFIVFVWIFGLLECSSASTRRRVSIVARTRLGLIQ